MRSRHPESTSGFSLVEMLVVIAVIGILAAIAVPSITRVNENSRTVTAQRNAQELATLYNSARAADIEFASTDEKDIYDELVAGKTASARFSNVGFHMTALSDEDRDEALKYVTFREDRQLLVYDRIASEEVAEEVTEETGEEGAAAEDEEETVNWWDRLIRSLARLFRI